MALDETRSNLKLLFSKVPFFKGGVHKVTYHKTENGLKKTQ